MLIVASAVPSKRRRLKPLRPRLGNTWQDPSWRAPLIGRVPREPAPKLPVIAKRPGKARAGVASAE